MSRGLAPEVDKHLNSNHAYLRKKACLTMARCFVNYPVMVEYFIEYVVSLFKNINHGIVAVM